MNTLFTCEHLASLVLNPALRHQSLSRALEEREVAFAAALETVFAEGHHEPAAVAAALQARSVAHPLTGATGWTADLLHSTLQALNATLDAAYADRGIGP